MNNHNKKDKYVVHFLYKKKHYVHTLGGFLDSVGDFFGQKKKMLVLAYFWILCLGAESSRQQRKEFWDMLKMLLLMLL